MKLIYIVAFALSAWLFTTPSAKTPDLTIREIMAERIDPTADEIWGAAGIVIDEKGTHEIKPQNDADWANVRAAAERLASYARDLRAPGRRAGREGEPSKHPWAEFAPAEVDKKIATNRPGFEAATKDLENIAKEIATSTSRQSPEELMTLGGRLQNTCDQCHMAFWYMAPKRDKKDHWRK